MKACMIKNTWQQWFQFRNINGFWNSLKYMSRSIHTWRSVVFGSVRGEIRRLRSNLEKAIINLLVPNGESRKNNRG
jgi:hypothetical protein